MALLSQSGLVTELDVRPGSVLSYFPGRKVYVIEMLDSGITVVSALPHQRPAL